MKQAPVYQPQRYASMTVPGQSLAAPGPGMMPGGYPSNSAYSNAYAPTQVSSPSVTLFASVSCLAAQHVYVLFDVL